MKFLVLSFLQFYKTLISPFLPPSCRFEPTCSTYAMQAVEKYGAIQRNLDGRKTYFTLSTFLQRRL